jgi:hypothetical protein
MEHGPSPIHYVLVPPPPVASNHIISAFKPRHQAFPLVKVNTTNGNAYSAWGCIQYLSMPVGDMRINWHQVPKLLVGDVW